MNKPTLLHNEMTWADGDRAKYYDVEKYLTHINGCKGSGDQSCPCGMAAVRWNIDNLLDAVEDHYKAVASQADTEGK